MNLGDTMLTCHLTCRSIQSCLRLAYNYRTSANSAFLNSDLNKVIMEYLIKEGYPAAAQKFAAEANMPNKPDYEAIQARVSIRDAIYSGNIQTAIEKINELAPQVGSPAAAVFCQEHHSLSLSRCYD